jgi:hypothetical protein
MSEICTHLDQVEIMEVPTRDEVPGCEDCLRLGMRWVHLRICRTCGRIGCCDSSPGRHASGHAREVDHPVATSIEPGENWSWCFVDEVAFVLSAQ